MHKSSNVRVSSNGSSRAVDDSSVSSRAVSAGDSSSDGVQTVSKQTRLTRRQSEILDFVYSRRFVTTRQVQQFLGKRQIQQAQQRLNTLLAKEYIGRRYSNQDKLLGRYAIYFLMPKGLELFKRRHRGSPKALRLMQKDATASNAFLQHSIAIADVVTDLLRLYPDPDFETTFMTKTDNWKYDADHDDGSEDYQPWTTAYPKPLPDGHFSTRENDGIFRYITAFVEVWHDNVPFWVYRKRIEYYTEFVYGDEQWESVMEDDQLNILLICDTPRLQQRVQGYLRSNEETRYDDNLTFFVTNRELLKTAKPNGSIWTVVGDEKNQTIRLIGGAATS